MNEYLVKGKNLINEAVELDDKGDFQGAYSTYLIGLNWFDMARKQAGTEGLKAHISMTMKKYMERAEMLGAEIKIEKETERKRLTERVAASMAPTPAKQSGSIRESMDNKAMGVKPKARLDDVAGLVEAKRALREAVLMPVQAPHLWEEGEASWSGILLYGPPGTGKSFLASAIAGEAGCTFYSISTSDLISKWVGESEQQIKALFESARKNKPAIIFIDEIEGVLAARSQDRGNSSEAHGDRVVGELLSQLDGVGKDNTGILFLGATNIPWILDSAGLRRTEKRIYIPLPDEDAREYMLKRALGDKINQATLDDLVSCSHGYSGADIKVFLKEVSMLPRRRISEATHFKGVSTKAEGMVFYPGDPEDPDCIECTFDKFSNKELLRKPKLTHEDYIECLKRTRPTVDTKTLKRYEEWTSSFGTV